MTWYETIIAAHTAVSQAVQLPRSTSNWSIFCHTRRTVSDRQSSRSWGLDRMGAMMYRSSGP